MRISYRTWSHAWHDILGENCVLLIILIMITDKLSLVDDTKSKLGKGF